jgi:tRNA (mo5U34)-methyltransferase
MNARPAAATRPLTTNDIRRRVAELGEWFHNLDLHGVQTAPNHFLHDYPNVKWQHFQHAIPDDLTGKSVLDIGCNAGFYSLEMKRRGASRVLGLDTDDRYLAQARLAAEVLGADIEFRNLSVYDLAQLGERFDVVIFMGVLYHLRHPLLALDIIHDTVAGDVLLFQAMQRGSSDIHPTQPNYSFFESDHFNDPGYPKLHFIEHQYADDWTNWWAPNAACAEAMLRSAGFEITDRPEQEVYICRRVERPTKAGAVYPTRPAPRNAEEERG